jgi:excisionase family DNA binding protein
VTSIPRVTLRCPAEAAEALGVSPDYFDEHVRHELKVVRRGRLVLVSLSELERWVRANEARAL